MLRRAAQLGVVAGTAGATYVALRNNQWDPSNIGVVRFGRAALAVSDSPLDGFVSFHCQCHHAARFSMYSTLTPKFGDLTCLVAAP